MHMADALVAPAVAGTMYACSAAAAGWAVKKVQEEDDPKKVPLMGVMGAFVFAGQMINFTIPGTGSSGHLCGGMLASAVLGPFAGFLTMIGVLLIQCLLFADGGLLALGCNIWNMAFYGCFIGAGLLWRRFMKTDRIKGNYICIRYRMYPYLTAGSTFRDSRDTCFGHYRAAFWSVCSCYAADPSGHRTGGRTDHCCGALFPVRGQAGAYLDRRLREICGRRKEAEALFPKSAACTCRRICTDRRRIIPGCILKSGRA